MLQSLLKYVGSVKCTAGETYAGSAFTLGNIMQMKTKAVQVSVAGGPAFLITFDDLAYVDTTANYTFNKDCIIAFCEMVEVT